METQTSQALAKKQCQPCSGETAKYSLAQAQQQLAKLSGWQLHENPDRISQSWLMRDFMAAIDLFNRVAVLAEAEDHHPDLHLENYRNVRIDLSTHAVGGLSENDFILAAKIDTLDKALKK